MTSEPPRATGPDIFGRPLQPDPAVALPPLDLKPSLKSGPLYKVQFVLEFVGPRSVSAQLAGNLLAPDWYAALGQPHVFGMHPSDLSWSVMVPARDGSYDSLAIAWDLLTPKGHISVQAATHLLGIAERFGASINRRVLPLPVPQDVDRAVELLRKAQESLDIGFALNVISHSGGFLEGDLWIQCARLGFEFASGGSFDWRTPAHPHPLLSVTPISQVQAFSLAGVQAGLRHDGVTIGFSVPLSIAPSQALEACFYTADRFAADLGGDVSDEDGRRLTDRIRQDLRASLKQALGLFSQLGITTGSPEALKLFAT